MEPQLARCSTATAEAVEYLDIEDGDVGWMCLSALAREGTVAFDKGATTLVGSFRCL